MVHSAHFACLCVYVCQDFLQLLCVCVILGIFYHTYPCVRTLLCAYLIVLRIGNTYYISSNFRCHGYIQTSLSSSFVNSSFSYILGGLCSTDITLNTSNAILCFIFILCPFFFFIKSRHGISGQYSLLEADLNRRTVSSKK